MRLGIFIGLVSLSANSQPDEISERYNTFSRKNPMETSFQRDCIKNKRCSYGDEQEYNCFLNTKATSCYHAPTITGFSFGSAVHTIRRYECTNAELFDSEPRPYSAHFSYSVRPDMFLTPTEIERNDVVKLLGLKIYISPLGPLHPTTRFQVWSHNDNGFEHRTPNDISDMFARQPIVRGLHPTDTLVNVWDFGDRDLKFRHQSNQTCRVPELGGSCRYSYASNLNTEEGFYDLERYRSRPFGKVHFSVIAMSVAPMNSSQDNLPYVMVQSEANFALAKRRKEHVKTDQGK